MGIQQLTGRFVAAMGKGTLFPSTWRAKKSGAASRSTTEAETISLSHLLFSEALPLQELMTLPCQQDITATIQVIRNGCSSRLRRISKTRKIDLTGLFDAFRSGNVILEYCSTEQQAADLFTKCLDAVKFRRALDMVGEGEPLL